MEEKGINPRKALPSNVIPLIEAAGDAEDETLAKMFAGLLAANLNPATQDSVHPSYLKVLAQLAPLDAVIVDAMHKEIKIINADKNTAVSKIEDLVISMNVQEGIILLSMENLWRLGICDHGRGLALLNREKQLRFTDYGWAMMEACSQT